jgi:broad-specificity NMP kinase
MKKLIFINGPMGVGKTAVCQHLYQQLPDSVWLDGDWCWMMHPWRVTQENKQMVEDNIVHLLGSFLRNLSFQHVIFCWVMHQEAIAQRLLARLRLEHEFELYRFSLLCSPEALSKRLEGRGTPQQTEDAVARLPLFEQQNTLPIDTTNLLPAEVAELIASKVSG